MNLWLDDLRSPPNSSEYGRIWYWAETAAEAINALHHFRWEWASLDHDLSDAHYAQWREQQYGDTIEPAQVIAPPPREMTGYDVALWMAENNTWPTYGVVVHSFNRVGAERICGVVDRYAPYDKPCLWVPCDLKGNPVPKHLVP